MWHVIQTLTGSEEEMLSAIHQRIPQKYYKECFLIWRECIRKVGEEYHIYQTKLFPSYLFVVTETPDELYYALKQVPKLTKLLSDSENEFLTVSAQEQLFLERIQDHDHVVRRSLVKVDEERQITSAQGPLAYYLDRMVKQRLRKRTVWIEQEFLGKTRRIMLGIKLDDENEVFLSDSKQ